MISQKLLNPQSIVVVGASNDVQKPGGKLLKNLLESNFKGKVYVVNPKEAEIQGIKCHAKVEDLPQVDCALMAIASKYCLHTVEVLAKEKGCGGYVIISAGFSEEYHEGGSHQSDDAHTRHVALADIAKDALHGDLQRLRGLLRHTGRPGGQVDAAHARL